MGHLSLLLGRGVQVNLQRLAFVKVSSCCFSSFSANKCSKSPSCGLQNIPDWLFEQIVNMLLSLLLMLSLLWNNLYSETEEYTAIQLCCLLGALRHLSFLSMASSRGHIVERSKVKNRCKFTTVFAVHLTHLLFNQGMIEN